VSCAEEQRRPFNVYQVNATVPPGTPSGPMFVKLAYFSGAVSNAVPWKFLCGVTLPVPYA